MYVQNKASISILAMIWSLYIPFFHPECGNHRRDDATSGACHFFENLDTVLDFQILILVKAVQVFAIFDFTQVQNAEIHLFCSENRIFL